MASFERPKTMDKLPADLLAVIRNSGVLGERQLDEIKSKIVRGDYPIDALPLAERLVSDEILTVYQARRLLGNKPNGLLVGRYIILDRIGSGSMGRVYKAHHPMMDRVVAIKVIAPEISSNQKVVARFQREMKLAGRLDHPNVVRAFDADQINQVLFIVMEYVPGISMGERLKKGPAPAQEVFEIGYQSSLGLAHAHEQGMVHRDIKPSNILMTEDRKVKILDLGLGVLMEADDNATFATADGIAVGTVDYMSPEQALGREVDGRSDIFSLGCTMYHLMTGKLAFPGESPIDRLGRRINSRHVPVTEHLPEFPPSAGRVLDKMLALKPSDRFGTATEAAEALQSVIRPRSRTSSKPASSPPRESARPGPNAYPSPASSTEPPTPEPVSPPIVTTIPIPLVSAPPVTFPAWFTPLAKAVERRPTAVLVCVIAVLALVFGAGVALGYALNSSG